MANVTFCICGLDWNAVGALGQWVGGLGTVASIWYLRKQIVEGREQFQKQLEESQRQFHRQLEMNSAQFQEQLNDEGKRSLQARHDGVLPYLDIAVQSSRVFPGYAELVLLVRNAGLGIARNISATFVSGSQSEIQKVWDSTEISVGESTKWYLDDIPRPASGWLVFKWDDLLDRRLERRLMIEDLNNELHVYHVTTEGSRGVRIHP